MMMIINDNDEDSDDDHTEWQNPNTKITIPSPRHTQLMMQYSND